MDGTADADGGSKITPPAVIFQVDPEYSEQAGKAKYSGSEVLLVEVDATGQVTGARVNRSLRLGLDEKTVEAVTRWKFRPGMKDVMPVGRSFRWR